MVNGLMMSRVILVLLSVQSVWARSPFADLFGREVKPRLLTAASEGLACCWIQFVLLKL